MSSKLRGRFPLHRSTTGRRHRLQGVIDGGDLPIVNMKALKIYEVSKYASMTYHNYGPTNG